MAAAEEDDPASAEQRKGRSNAILTYERINEFVTRLASVDAKMDSLADTVRRAETAALRTHSDLEPRIRSLENTQAAMLAGKNVAQWVWAALLGAGQLLFAALAFFFTKL